LNLQYIPNDAFSFDTQFSLTYINNLSFIALIFRNAATEQQAGKIFKGKRLYTKYETLS